MKEGLKLVLLFDRAGEKKESQKKNKKKNKTFFIRFSFSFGQHFI